MINMKRILFLLFFLFLLRLSWYTTD